MNVGRSVRLQLQCRSSGRSQIDIGRVLQSQVDAANRPYFGNWARCRTAMAQEEGVRLFSGPKKRSASDKHANLAEKRRRETPAEQSEQPLSDGTAPVAQQNGQALDPAVEFKQDDASVSFKSLGLSDWLYSLCKSLGMTQPTEVQQGCIPSILAGRDVIGTAHTGSGKTAAFALPILQKLAQDPYGVYALVLTPTRCVS